MDGVLADSERIYEAAFHRYMRAAGRPELGARFPATLGRRQADFLPELAAELGLSVKAVAAGLGEAERETWAREALRPMPFAHEALARARRGGRLVGLASSSRRATIARVLAALGMERAFATIAAGDEVSRGKPDAAVYRLAADRPA